MASARVRLSKFWKTFFEAGLRLELSVVAERDLLGIFDWTERNFGLAQASRYQASLISAMNGLRDAPQIGRLYPGAKRGVMRITAGRHYIYYRFDAQTLRIVRVLHQRMSQARHLA